LFQIVEVEDIIRIEPINFGNELNEIAKTILKGRYESTITPDLGYVILIMNVNAEKTGKIIPGDGATYHTVQFKLLSFLPKLHEIVEGEVVEITDFGAFIRVGPTDALLHLSQITDEYLNSDVRQGLITAKESNRTVQVGTNMRVRITALSLTRGTSMGKIGVTCRQPFLGSSEWIQEDLKKALKSKQPNKTSGDQK
jgi:DNA-directed RNA polymerase subunit E'|tara:strand:+ start:26 stop:616 length:591 start_codon:yes stop_codon:yes gene_type:complete